MMPYNLLLTPTAFIANNFFILCVNADFILFQMKPYVDWFKWDDAKHPLSNAPEPKRRFIPSKWEHKKVRTHSFYCFYLMKIH